jgi:hypothetical protein
MMKRAGEQTQNTLYVLIFRILCREPVKSLGNEGTYGVETKMKRKVCVVY